MKLIQLGLISPPGRFYSTHYSGITWVSVLLKLLASWLFVKHFNAHKKGKCLILALLTLREKNLVEMGGFPTQRASNVERTSTSGHHHAQKHLWNTVSTSYPIWSNQASVKNIFSAFLRLSPWEFLHWRRRRNWFQTINIQCYKKHDTKSCHALRD